MPSPGLGSPFRWRPRPALRLTPTGRKRRSWVAICIAALAATAVAAAQPRVGADLSNAGDPYSSVAGESEHTREYKIKAAFLYNFVRYTTWPASTFADDKAPIVIEIVGNDPFGAIIDDTFGDKLLHSRRVEIRRSKAIPAEIRAHLVFASNLPDGELKKLLARSQHKPVLVMGESKGFALSGACGNFFIEDEKVRFEINIDAVSTAQLQISSQLLKLARIVRDPGSIEGPK